MHCKRHMAKNMRSYTANWSKQKIKMEKNKKKTLLLVFLTALIFTVKGWFPYDRYDLCDRLKHVETTLQRSL